MNIAFSALLVFFLALPGIIVLRVFRYNENRPAGSRALTDDIPHGLLISIIIHSLGLLSFNHLGGCATWPGESGPIQVNLNAVLALLASQFGKDSHLLDDALNSITAGYRPGYILLYGAFTSTAAAFLGACLRQVETPLLKWNKWDYVLAGKLPDGSSSDGDFDAVRVTAVVGEYLYWGILSGYSVDSNGDLDVIYLVLAKRRKLGDGERSGGSGTGFSIQTDILALKYSECKNVGVLKIWLKDEQQAHEPRQLILPLDD